MLYTPLLPEAAAGVIEPRHVVVPLRRVLRRTRLLLGRATAIDFERRTVTVTPPEGPSRTLGWDRLVLTAGSVSRLLPIPGLAAHARGFKTLAEGIYLRNHVLQQLELADAADDQAERSCRCTFVVAGAGYAGTELVAELQAMTTRALSAYPGLRPLDVRWVLVDVAPTILPELGGDLGRRALRILRRRGVDVRLETSVAEVGDGWVRLSDGERLATRTLVWTAGVAPQPSVAELGLPTDARGRLLVDRYLAVQGRDDVFALGDNAAVPDPAKPDRPAPPTAQHALREAKTLAHNIHATICGKPLKPFRFRAVGALAVLGHQTACAEIFGLKFSGLLAWWLWRMIYLGKLPTLEKRVRVALDWAVDLFFPRDIVYLRPLHNRHGAEAIPTEGPATAGVKADLSRR
jgi:NADH dehydrogenase